jgi:hypothetical protein
VDNSLRHHSTKARHPVGQPPWNVTPVQRQISAASSSRHPLSHSRFPSKQNVHVLYYGRRVGATRENGRAILWPRGCPRPRLSQHRSAHSMPPWQRSPMSNRRPSCAAAGAAGTLTLTTGLTTGLSIVPITGGTGASIVIKTVHKPPSSEPGRRQERGTRSDPRSPPGARLDVGRPCGAETPLRG